MKSGSETAKHDRILQEMSLEELWKLFPIELSQHNPLWKEWAHEEIEFLSRLLSDYTPIIHHIGSTSIPNIKAKPIVDILVEIAEEIDYSTIGRIMENVGYILMSKSGERLSFNKGYTPDGYAERVFHIHVHRTGDNDEIFFRDHLTANEETAKEYERLKLSLLPTYKHDRDGYTEAKSEFIKRICAEKP